MSVWIFCAIVSILCCVSKAQLFDSFQPRTVLGGENCQTDCSEVTSAAVCGSDGRTYDSLCELQSKRCQGDEVEYTHDGKCKAQGRCMFERIHALKMSKQPKSVVFIPQCEEDGMYSKVQCHQATGYCWCVTPDGKPVPSTSVPGMQKPNCNGSGGDSLPPPLSVDYPKKGTRGDREELPTKKARKRKRKSCSQSDRSSFNHNLVSAFQTEYSRLPEHNYEKDAFSNWDDLHLKKSIVQWKFAQLDKNGDSALSKKEVRQLRKVVKKYVKPRPCARNFVRYCDLNQDNQILRKEWSLCLGIDTTISFRLFLSLNSDDTSPAVSSGFSGSSFKEATSGESSRGPSILNEHQKGRRRKIRKPKKIRKKSSSKVTEGGFANCDQERAHALKMKSREPGEQIFIPNCTPTGNFESIQCHDLTGYCWCVESLSGRPISGTSTLNQRPDCLVEEEDTNWKGCKNDKKKQKFMQELIQDILKAIRNESGDENLDVGHLSSVAIFNWKYNKLDRNNNKVLERREWKSFKLEMKLKGKMHKCGRNFLRYCDTNQDRKVTMKEWNTCTEVIERRSSRRRGRRRRGPNPINAYLRD